MGYIEAVFRQGVFVPLEVVELGDDQRVRLNFVPSDAANHWSWLRSVQELQQAVVARSGVLPDSTLEIAVDRRR